MNVICHVLQKCSYGTAYEKCNVNVSVVCRNIKCRHFILVTGLNTRDTRVHHYCFLCLFNQLNQSYPYSGWVGALNQKYLSNQKWTRLIRSHTFFQPELLKLLYIFHVAMYIFIKIIISHSCIIQRTMYRAVSKLSFRSMFLILRVKKCHFTEQVSNKLQRINFNEHFSFITATDIGTFHSDDTH